MSTPVLNAIQSIDQMSQAASKTSNTRMKVLAAGSAGLSAYNAYNQVAAGQGSRINGIDNQIATGKTNPDKTPETRDATAMDKVGGIDIAVSFGSSSSESHSVQQANQARGSTISAGGNLTISATGAGANSNLLIEGGQLSAGKNIALAADNAITLKAAQSTSEQHSSNNASSGSVGFSVGSSGFIGNASFSKSKGKGDGSDVTNTLTHVNAGNQLTIISGSDTNLQGAVVAGKQVTMDVGKDLNIESVQDLSTYQGRQENFGGSFSFGAGKPSASINIGRGKVDGSYASVIEQSGVVAGDGGFNIKVNGNTDLKGGKIASTEQAANSGKNTLTTNTLTQSNIQNKDSYQAESTSASFGGGGSMGYGSSSSSASSVTESGISAGKVTIKDDAAQQAKTGKTAAETIASINTKVTEKDSSGKLSKDWNGQQLMEDVTAQAQIMQSFGSQAAKAIGDYAKIKLKNLSDQLAIEPDASKRAEIYSEIEKWKEGGSYRVALHTAAGALSGDLGGALGAGVSATAMPQISKQIAEMHLPEAVQKGLEQVTATALGAVVGGNNGAAVSLNVDVNNRQLHEDGKAKEKTLAKKLAEGSSGKYTQAQIEDALRSANNNQLGETASTGAVVPYDAKTNFTIYDKTGMILGKAPDGSPVLMQNPAMLAIPSSDLQSYIKNNTGNTYSWNTAPPQLSWTPSAALPSILPGTVTPEMLADRKIYAADAADKLSTGTGLAAIWAPPPFDVALAGLSGVFKGTNYLLSPPSPASALLDSTFTVLPIFLPQTKFVQTGFGMGATMLQPIITPFLDNSLNQATTCSPPKKC